MQPKITTIAPKALIGLHRDMSLADNQTQELWRTFMPRRSEIANRTSRDFLSMQVYGDQPGPLFAPDRIFSKWAAVEVSSHDLLPDGMAPYLLNGGQYAVFFHRGPASSAPQIMQYIFGEWMPKSGYSVDNREHFEVLGPNYNPADPNACDEIWIPVRNP